MAKIVNKIIQALDQNDQVAVHALIQDGCKQKKLSFSKLEQIQAQKPSELIHNMIQGVTALATLSHISATEYRAIECAFLAEAVLSSSNTYIKQEGYDLQFDPTTQRRYIHLHDALIGKGYAKKVTEVIRYDHDIPKLFVSCEAKGNLHDEIQAMKRAEGLPGVIQAEAVMTRTTKKGELKTALIQKKFTPGPLYKVAGELSINKQVKIARDLLVGLQGMHGRDLIHRDIKPDNVLYDEATEEAVLADLGQSKTSADARDLAPNATIIYNPPEAMFHDRTKNDLKKADIFSLGCVLYRLHFKEKLPWMKDSILSSKVLGKDYHDRPLRKKFIKKVKVLRYKLGLSIEKKPKTAETNLKRVILGMLHQQPEKRPDITKLLELLK